jgi:Na+-translocating ferredoxin:NAD+ oxidoreductase RnfG subunit
MLKSVPIHNGAHQQRAQDAELLKESGAHKLVITDRDGNCLAFVLAWDSFDYDPESDTYVCVAANDGRELMTVYTAGEIKSVPGANMYVLTAPDGFSGRRAL